MVGSVEELAQQFGHTTLSTPGYNTANTGVVASAPKAPNFFGDLGHSLVTIPGQIAGAAGNALGSAFHNVAGGISEALTSGAQNNANEQYRQQLESASRQYDKMYSSGKLSKAAYTKLSNDTIKQLQSLSGSISNDVSNMVAPKDFATGLATVGSLPFAAGSLEATGAPGVLGAAERVAGAKVASAGGSVAKTLLKAPVKAALNAQTATTPIQAASDLKHGNLAGAAENAAFLAAPGIIKGAEKAGAALKTAAFGVKSTLGDVFGNARLQKFMETATPAQANSLKRMEMFTENHNTSDPGAFLTNHYKTEIGIDPKTTDIGQAVKQFDNYAEAHGTLEQAKTDVASASQQAIAHNKVARAEAKAANAAAEARAAHVQATTPIPEDVNAAMTKTGSTPTPLPMNETAPVAKVKANTIPVPKAIPSEAVVSHDFRQALPAAKEALAGLDASASPAQRIAAVDKALDQMGVLNKTVGNKIGAEILSAPKGEEAAALDKIVQKSVIDHPNLNLPKGFIATYGPKERAALPTAEEAAQAGDIAIGKDANRVLGGAVKGLEKAGLGLQAPERGTISTTLKNNFAQALKSNGIEGADVNELYNAINSVKKMGVSDARMLNNTELQGALANVEGITRADVPKIRQSILQAYADLPKEQVGIGGKALNQAIAKVPGLNKYLRYQSAGRYEAPLLSLPFRLKQATKGALIAGAEGANTLKVEPETMQTLEDLGKFNARTPAGSDATLSEQLGSNGQYKPLNPEQQFIKGTLAQSVVNGTGKSLKQLHEEGGPVWDQLNHALDLTTSYGKGGYLNSPFAKTLNLVVFPSRFDTKVMMEAGKALGKLDPVKQVGVVAGIANTKHFLDSPKGQQWQKDNSELIGLVKYFTPLGTIDGFSKFLNDGHHIGDLGEIGGLPVGVLTTLLHDQGINTGVFGSSDFRDAKTGELVPQKIPQGAKSRAQQALTDIVGTMYSYPGRTAGLSSKSSLTQTAVPFLKPGQTKSVMPDGSPAPAPGAKTVKISNRTAPAVEKLPFNPNPGRTNLPAIPKKISRPAGRKGKTLAKLPGQF